MANLKDLIVNGNSRFIGKSYISILKSNKFALPSSSTSTTKSAGTSGQIVMSNGTNSYWGTPS